LGILALQMDFIGRDDLVAGMQAWVFDKKRTLGDLLVERGNLPPARRDMLEGLVEEHLKSHGGDARESLAALGNATEAAHDLRAIGDADVEMSIAALDPCPESTGPYVPQAPDGVRYQVLRRHAKGGLGEVFVALDQSLNREVAIKEIQERHANDPASRNRFVLEAEITGRLEHPGIVPVYDLGHHPDGRPYYAMRFVRGETLKEAIRSFHAADVHGRSPGERTLAFRQLLRRFIDACNAVAYAHSRGVLHRDLKPANIMLGKYGETLIVDWGLAKPVGRDRASADSAEESLRPAASSSITETIAGTAVGTPAYMSPEQASGRLGTLGPTTDIYGLGSCLYTLLTGNPPVEDGEVGEVLRRVQRGEITPPRRVNARTPLALEAVCLKAMALSPDDRYPAALSLAGDVEHWLADEPVLAWKEPLMARSCRWVRRHQSAVGSAMAATLVILLCLAASLGIVARAYRQEKDAREYAVEQEGEAHRQRASAEERAGQIEERFRADREATEKVVAESLRVPVENSPDELGIRFERSDYFLRRSRTMDAATGFTWHLAGKYRSIGDSLRRKGNHAEGAIWFEKARAVYEQLTAERREEPIIAFELAELYLDMGQLDAERAEARKAGEWFDRASAVANDRFADDPLERLFTHDMIMRLNAAGDGLQAGKHARAALAFHERAVAVAEKELKGSPEDAQFLRDVAASNYRLGVAKLALKLPMEAVAHEEKVKSVLETLSKKQLLPADARKTLARAYHSAALALAAAGKISEALREHEQAVVLRERLVNPQARDVAYTLELADEYRQIYVVHRGAGQQQDCQTWCERAATTFGRLSEDYPSVREYAYARDEMLVRRAVALARQGRHEEATKSAMELLDHKSLPPGDLYNLACLFAISVAHIQADSTLAAAKRQQLTESYTAQATRLLGKAKAGGYFAHPAVLADLRNDPDLQAIRSAAEFQQILSSLEGKGRSDGGSKGSARR